MSSSKSIKISARLPTDLVNQALSISRIYGYLTMSNIIKLGVMSFIQDFSGVKQNENN